MNSKACKVKLIISKPRDAGVFLFILYLLFFSIFALHHVYVANELDDSHGCAIGEWVHLGQQAAISFLLLITVYLLSCCPDKNVTIFLIRTLLWKDHPKRGPPPTLLPI